MNQLRNNAILSACLVTLLAPCWASGAEKGKYFIEVGPTTTTQDDNEYPVRIVSIPTIGFNMRFVQYARPGYERPAGGDDGGLAPEFRTLTLNPYLRTDRPSVSADGESFGQPGPAGNGQGRAENDPSQLTPGTAEPTIEARGRKPRTTVTPYDDSFRDQPTPDEPTDSGRPDLTRPEFDPTELTPGSAPDYPKSVINEPRTTSSPDGESFPENPGGGRPDLTRPGSDPSQLTPATENPFQFSNAQGEDRPEDPSEIDPGEADPEEEVGDPDDGQPDDDEFLPPDCNGNGVADSDEIAANFGLDSDGNGRIDRCEQSGDVNYDGRIDMDDLVAVILAWGTCPGGDGTCHADVNQDGQINEEDVAVIFVHWNFEF